MLILIVKLTLGDPLLSELLEVVILTLKDGVTLDVTL